MSSGNKSDKVSSREVPASVGEEFARRQEMFFLETSAKEAENVEKLFHDIARELVRRTKANEIPVFFEEEVKIPQTRSQGLEWSGCCAKLY